MEEGSTLKRLILTLLTLTAALTACASGAPKAVTPVTAHDFGTVPVVASFKQAQTKEFVIRNDGTGPLRLSDVRVKLLEGC